jgi:septal ring factor EnvC (AmiA/AmiB activator)
MAEESETPGGESPWSTDRDLLAERRARRAADSESAHPPSSPPTDVLIHRAEAAEATVQTLEAHLASLQQRVREAAEERALFSERLNVEQAMVAEREHELRRVKQREYAEQQLRVEAEDRHTRLEHDSRAEIDRLTRRLGASEHHARELSQRLESAQRELDEAEQAAIAGLGELRSAGELELRARFAELERHALEIRHEIDGERSARVQAERRLAEMHAGYRRMEVLVAELRGTMVQLRAAATREPGAGETPPMAPTEHREELADALAAAVERLRARAEASAAESVATEHAELVRSTPASSPAESPPVPITSLVDPPSEPERQPTGPVAKSAPHKHSMSLLTRTRLRRKQRRERRFTAAEPPKIQPQ